MTDQAEMQSPEDRLMNLLDSEFPDEPGTEPIEAEAEEPQEEEVKAEEEGSEEETAEPVKLKLKRGDEEVEVDIEEAKNLAQMGYDYTKKTQEVAEQRKQVEMYAQAIKAQEYAIQQQAELQTAFIKEIAKVESINERIAQYEGLDWNALTDNDPVQAQKLYIQYQQLQNNRNMAQAEIQQKQQYLTQQRYQQQQMALESARVELLKVMPDFNAQKAQELREIAKQYGYTDDDLAGVTDPRQVRILADAAAYRKLKADKVNVTNKVQGKPPVVKPGAKDTNAVDKSKHAQMRQNLRKSGRHQDAAALIERML